MENHYNIEKSLQIITQIGQSLIRGFQLLENDLKVYKALILYFHNDSEFEKLNSAYNLKKGIFLHGNIGTGKSRVFQIFNLYVKKYLPNRSFQIVKTNDIADDFSNSGLSAIQKHGILSFKKNPENVPILEMPLAKCYDDLGVEPKIVKSYGNERNVMADILLKRYDLFIQYEMKTFMSTNYNADGILENYGDRVRSRLREMCNDITYHGKDRRR